LHCILKMDSESKYYNIHHFVAKAEVEVMEEAEMVAEAKEAEVMEAEAGKEKVVETGKEKVSR